MRLKFIIISVLLLTSVFGQVKKTFIYLPTSETDSVITDVEDSNIDFIFYPEHLAAWDSNLVFKNNSATKFYLSTDFGNTFRDTLTITSFGTSIFSTFYNGNIIWGREGSAALFISKDSLTTYDTVVILDIEGNPFTAQYGDEFKPFLMDNYNESGLLVWGNYKTLTATPSVRVNVWYTTTGDTVKSAFEFNASTIGGDTISATHIHSVNYNASDTSWWVATGDFTDECNWLKGKYNFSTDTWTWELIASDDEYSYHKVVGLFYYDGYMYWASDSNDPNKSGLYRAPYATLTDTSTYENLYQTQYQMTSIYIDNEGKLVAAGLEDGIIISSNDRVHFNRTAINTPDSIEISQYYCGLILSRPTNYQGYVIAEYYENNPIERIYNYTKGATALLKVRDLCKPSPPESFRIFGFGETNYLNWLDPLSIDSVMIYRGLTTNPTTKIATILPNVETYTDTGLDADATYYYRMRAYSDCGYSNYTVTVEDTGGFPTRTLGDELIADTAFVEDCGVNWLCGINWEITGGKAVGTVTANNLSDIFALANVLVGDSVQVTFTIEDYVAGTIRAEVPIGVSNGTIRSADGTYTETLYFNGANNQFNFNAIMSFTGKITKVSVRKVIWQ